MNPSDTTNAGMNTTPIRRSRHRPSSLVQEDTIMTTPAPDPAEEVPPAAAEVNVAPVSPEEITQPIRRSRSQLPRPTRPEEVTSPPAPTSVATTQPTTAEVVETPCPRCGGKLIDPAGLGWCQRCGYCRSLEEDKSRLDIPRPNAAAPQGSSLGMFEFCALLAKVPSWVGPLICGAAAVVMINIPASQLLTPDSLPRAVWTTSVVVLGVLMILAAQFWALMTIVADDEELG